MESDLAAAIALLDQAAELARKINTTAWTDPSPPFRNSTIGQHFRHTLDHFESLVTHSKDQIIDYDYRRRDQTIENSPVAAADRCCEILDDLGKLGETYRSDHPYYVKSSCSVAGAVTTQSSSFGRELHFLLSHTIHHFAIIGAICHSLEIDLPPTFGIAPSTLKHREEMANR